MAATQGPWAAPQPATLGVQGQALRLPVNRLFFVGRNYHAHALEMGKPVDKSVEQPFYFTKSVTTLVASGATVPYPPKTANYQHEMELVVVLGAPGFRVKADQAHTLIFGYACGLDMTRRDLQLSARGQGRPWDLGKDFEHSCVVSDVLPLPGQLLTHAALELRVNGQVKQQSDISRLIWNIAELIADLSQYYHLQPGDVLFTGTPEGVGPVVVGDRLHGQIQGVGAVQLTIGAGDTAPA